MLFTGSALLKWKKSSCVLREMVLNSKSFLVTLLEGKVETILAVVVLDQETVVEAEDIRVRVLGEIQALDLEISPIINRTHL